MEEYETGKNEVMDATRTKHGCRILLFKTDRCMLKAGAISRSRHCGKLIFFESSWRPRYVFFAIIVRR
ncbi:MAG TPA: hypothetical protein DEB39_02250 [Planctomycetaceae bacterium]|nr:hypothetical protein [Planctomycetaceae bacterium]